MSSGRVAGARDLGRFWDRVRSLRLIRYLGSLELGLICMVVLFGLILAGTLYQVDFGLYAAQQKFFHSWFTTLGPVPLPGAQTAFAVLAVNLLVSTLFTIRYRWNNIGLFLIHIGLIVLVAGGFQAHIYARESVIGLAEGERTGVAYDPHQYELEARAGDQVYTASLASIKPGQRLEIPGTESVLSVVETYPNAEAELAADGSRRIVGLHELEPDRDPSRNRPAIHAVLGSSEEAGASVFLYGGENTSTTLAGSQGRVDLVLRPTRYDLPFTLALEDFHAEFYPRSDIPKEFTSRVRVIDGDAQRTAVISMNEPLRYGGYTLFQASYATDERDETLASIFAVVRNPARSLPYIVSLLIAVGLILHFALRVVRGRKRNV